MTKTEMLKRLADAKRDIAALQWQIRQKGKIEAWPERRLKLYARVASNASDAIGEVEVELADLAEVDSR